MSGPWGDPSGQPVENLPPLQLGVPGNENLTPFGDVDDWPMTGTAGQVVTITADTATSADVHVRLLDAVTRTVLATGVDGPDVDDSVITGFTLPTTGPYIVQVYRQLFTETGGSYGVTVQ